MVRPATINSRTLTLALVLAVAAAACGGRGSEATTTAPPDTAPATTAPPTATTTPPASTAAPTTTATTVPPTTASPLSALLRDFTGQWTGEWVNTTAGSQGPIFVVLEAVGDTTVSVTADLDGLVFGQNDPGAEQWIIGLEQLAGPVTVESATFGEVTLILSPDGARITAGDVPATGIRSFQLDAGFEIGPRIVGAYLVGFDDGTVAEGTMELQRIDP